VQGSANEHYGLNTVEYPSNHHTSYKDASFPEPEFTMPQDPLVSMHSSNRSLHASNSSTYGRGLPEIPNFTSTSTGQFSNSPQEHNSYSPNLMQSSPHMNSYMAAPNFPLNQSMTLEEVESMMVQSHMMAKAAQAASMQRMRREIRMRELVCNFQRS
jgi:hypothetical protein